MRKFFTSLVLALVLTSSSLAGVKVKQDYRMYNNTGNQCIWCCFETMGYTHQIKQLYGLTEDNPGAFYLNHVHSYLFSKSVKHRITTSRPDDITDVKTACDLGWGCIVTLYTGNAEILHAVIVTNVNEKSVFLIDNMDKELKDIEISREHFSKLWTGWSLLIWNPKLEQKKKE